MLDNILYIYFPYAAVVLAVVVSIQRYLTKKFSYSSLSSQFLEGEELFYGSVLWHYGIIGVLLGHLIGFLFPKEVLAFNRVPVRLYLLEITGLLFGLMAVSGIVALMVRRAFSARIRAVTSAMDAVVLGLLFTQVVLGLYSAIFYRWGSSWYAATLVPYLRSLVTLDPNIVGVVPLPLVVKLHILGAFLLVVVFPFSRLVHIVVVPLQYLWRSYQLTIWNRRRASRIYGDLRDV